MQVVQSTKKAAFQPHFPNVSNRDPVNRDFCVRMCYHWYTRGNNIRTIGAGIKIRQIGQREALVSFTVVGDDVKMIIEDIDSIDKCFDDMAAQKWITAVAFCKSVQEEDHTVMIKQLGLGKAHHVNRLAKAIRGGFQI